MFSAWAFDNVHCLALLEMVFRFDDTNIKHFQTVVSILVRVIYLEYFTNVLNLAIFPNWKYYMSE